MTREEASKILHALWRIYHHYLTEKEAEAVDTAIKALKQPEQKKGKWIDLGGISECSICHERSCCAGNYCPDCGAKMEEEE